MGFQIEIIEGHDPSSYFWFRPVILKETGKILWDEVVELEDEFSIEEGYVDCFLSYFLYNKLDKPEKIECIEPDFALHLHPKEDIRKNHNIVYVKSGCEIADIDMDLQVSFWDRDGGLSANRLLLAFGR